MRGRPIGSKIRNRIALVLNKVGFSYGYEIYKIYKKFFEPIETKSIYYNLNKGIDLGEFINVKVENKSGVYSWGDSSKVVWYGLGPFAKISDESINIQKKRRDFDIDYNGFAKKLLQRAGSRDEVKQIESWGKFNFNSETKTLLLNHKNGFSQKI